MEEITSTKISVWADGFRAKMEEDFRSRSYGGNKDLGSNMEKGKGGQRRSKRRKEEV